MKRAQSTLAALASVLLVTACGSATAPTGINGLFVAMGVSGSPLPWTNPTIHNLRITVLTLTVSSPTATLFEQALIDSEPLDIPVQTLDVYPESNSTFVFSTHGKLPRDTVTVGTLNGKQLLLRFPGDSVSIWMLVRQ